jgi:hypothetical protein
MVQAIPPKKSLKPIAYGMAKPIQSLAKPIAYGMAKPIKI